MLFRVRLVLRVLVAGITPRGVTGGGRSWASKQAGEREPKGLECCRRRLLFLYRLIFLLTRTDRITPRSVVIVRRISSATTFLSRLRPSLPTPRLVPAFQHAVAAGWRRLRGRERCGGIIVGVVCARVGVVDR